MDFIKTSSLRALIELTFQRNWNGLIWMSRKGVTTKRVRLSRRLYREQRPNRAVRLAEKHCSALGQITSVRLKSRPKFQTDRPITHDPGNIVPRSAKLQRSTPHRARPKRASRETRPRGRATVPRTTADASVRAGKERPTSGREFSSAKSQSARPRRPTANPIRPRPFVTPPFLKPKLMFSSPA
ncbi:unnamed protein product [Microthlaspi erraticum]|uniref:Uncharacterized protein n=1 Tax=Microthlaspi erraticum TaxID=1685480 RepID=A0A6D2IZ24_9BRAS|nr:unnamed protein product [Microthlaspi erraticum]